jgi:hypothetical protein
MRWDSRAPDYNRHYDIRFKIRGGSESSLAIGKQEGRDTFTSVSSGSVADVVSESALWRFESVGKRFKRV